MAPLKEMLAATVRRNLDSLYNWLLQSTNSTWEIGVEEQHAEQRIAEIKQRIERSKLESDKVQTTYPRTAHDHASDAIEDRLALQEWEDSLIRQRSYMNAITRLRFRSWAPLCDLLTSTGRGQLPVSIPRLFNELRRCRQELVTVQRQETAFHKTEILRKWASISWPKRKRYSYVYLKLSILSSWLVVGQHCDNVRLHCAEFLSRR